jgi:hypothetical protein
MAQRVEDCSFVRTPVRHFVGAAVCMHKCKDGSVRQLCGLGIAPILQGHTKKVHVQQQRAPQEWRRMWWRLSPSSRGIRKWCEMSCQDKQANWEVVVW